MRVPDRRVSVCGAGDELFHFADGAFESYENGS